MTPPDNDLADLRLDPDDEPRYRIEESVIRNAEGEALFLRGINLSQVSKYGPEYLYPLELDDGALMVAHGFNSVRFLILWEAIMPESPDRVDRVYLAEVDHQLWMLESMGLRAVVDMHQDLWGPPFGDGAPLWACPEEIRAGYESQSPWWRNYMSPQVSGCFDRFWSSPELQDHFIEAWAEAAGALCHHRSVVGFDLINEPWPGSAFGDPRFENDVLMPFYRRTIEAIDAVCPGRLFFVEPLVTYMFGLTEPLDIPDELLDRVVLAPHFYPIEVHEPGEGYQSDLDSLEASFAGLFDDMTGEGTPLWIGEWGGISTNPGFEDYLRDFSELTLRRFTGSAIWEYSRGATSFSLLDRDGERREVFAPFRQMPAPAVLPQPPDLVEPRWSERSLSLDVRCREGALISMVLPGSGQGRCVAEPIEALEIRPALPGFFNGRCTSDEMITLDCRLGR